MCIPGIFNNGRFMNMTYDMIHGGLAGSMNLMFNQNIEHCMTFPTLYTMPNNIFNYSPYGTIGSNNYLLDPTFPIFQSQFGMGGNFGGYGMPMMPWMNPEMMKKMWSFDGTDSASSSTDSTTRKYNKMLSLLRNIANSDEVKQSVKDEINEAIRNNKGKVDEKLERLTKVYEDLDKDLVKKALREANNIGYAKKSTVKKDSFRTNLEAIGFEYGNGEVDKLVSKVYDDIKEIKKDGSATGNPLVGAINEDNILDFISSWNTEHADSSTKSDTRVLKHIAKYYNGMSDGKGTVRSNLINPLFDALRDKAKTVKADLPKAEKEKIDKAIEELNEHKGKNTISDAAIKAFDNLYVLVRMAALTSFNEEVIGYYGELDEDLFNEELFTEETIEDLKAEGFSKSAIEEANENVEVSDDDDNNDETTDGTSSGAATQEYTSTDKSEAKKIGRFFHEALNGVTDDSDWSSIQLKMDSVNTNNVFDILNAFDVRNYEFCTCSWDMSWSEKDGFFEWVDKEKRDEAQKLELQKQVLGKIIEAIENNLDKVPADKKASLEKNLEKLQEQYDSTDIDGNYVDKIVKEVRNKLSSTVGCETTYEPSLLQKFVSNPVVSTILAPTKWICSGIRALFG